ncbi:hypothetical protein [Apibacter sp. HY039]|uniref:hypothetical protein n=1 Tax=Apibacter sp. HY039 TaxID=2501476 RepID=UPI000FEBBAC2|nr:hypothetical protein [Apibacter sp. HY039]
MIALPPPDSVMIDQTAFYYFLPEKQAEIKFKVNGKRINVKWLNADIPIAVYSENELPDSYFGSMDMTLNTFHKWMDPKAADDIYNIPSTNHAILKRFPPTSSKIEIVKYQGDSTYILKNIDVAVKTNDLLTALIKKKSGKSNDKDLKIINYWHQFKNRKAVYNEYDKSKLPVYKVKYINKEGYFNDRELVGNLKDKTFRPLPSPLTFEKEYYYLMKYSYAFAVHFPESSIQTYDEFHDAYGKYVYAVEIRRPKRSYGLEWLDYIYHRPDHHLEAGIVDYERFKGFDQWNEGEELEVRVLADGFEDAIVKTRMKRPLQKHALLSPPKLKKNDILKVSLDEGLINRIKENPTIFEITFKENIKVFFDSKEMKFGKDYIEIPVQAFAKDGSGRYGIYINDNVYASYFTGFTLE